MTHQQIAGFRWGKITGARGPPPTCLNLFAYEYPVMSNNLSHHPCSEDQDRLDYKQYAATICDILSKLKIRQTGLAIGVFGDWGSGKSTILRIVGEYLNGTGKYWELPKDRSFLVIEFDAWRYIKQEELWLALMRKVIATLEKKVLYSRPQSQNRAKPWVVRFADWIVELLLSPIRFVWDAWELLGVNFNLWNNRLDTNYAFWFSLRNLLVRGVLIGILVWLALFVGTPLGKLINLPVAIVISLFIAAPTQMISSILTGKLDVALPALTRPGFDKGQSLLIDNFREDFRTIVKAVGKKRTVVVLIDDLDRCPFDQTLSILEAIKHFGFDDMEVPEGQEKEQAPIAFVLAADRRAIQQAVKGYYKNYKDQMSSSEEVEKFAREYIEKIVQVPFDLPPLTRTRLAEKLLK